MTLDGTVINIIKGSVANPMWSPDGNRLAFTCDNYGVSFNMCVTDANGENILKFQSRKQINGYFSKWSPDSKKLLYIAGSGYTRDFHVLWPEDNIDKKFATINYIHINGKFLDYDYQWSPDSQWLLIGGTPDQTNIYLANGTVKYTAPVICDLQAKCHGFENNLDGIVILKLEWAKNITPR